MKISAGRPGKGERGWGGPAGHGWCPARTPARQLQQQTRRRPLPRATILHAAAAGGGAQGAGWEGTVLLPATAGQGGGGAGPAPLQP